MLILKQNAANTVPTPPAGKGTIFLDDSDTLSVKTSDGNVETFPTVGAANSQVIFMNGTTLGGESDFTYDYNNNVLTLTGNIAANNVKTDNLLYANGVPWDLSDPGGSNTQLQFNDDESFGGSSALTFDKTSNVLTLGGNLSAGNVNATGITATSISGTTLAGSLTTNAQPNITSVGTLTSLAVTGNVTAGNVGGANLISGNFITGTLTTAAQPNITSVGTLSSLAVTGNVSAGNVSGTLLTGTLTSNAQPNITSVGTLTALSVSGNATAGNISATGDVSGATLTGTLTTNAQPNITSVGTLSSLAVTGNATAGNVYANSGTVGAANLTGTLTTAAQPNITSVGTLTSLAVTGNVTAGNVNAGNLLTANFVAATLTTAAQPNITSVGNLTGLTIEANGDISLSGSGSQITGANLVDAAYLTGTLTTPTQPNVTSLGTLTGLSVNGNIVAANITANTGVFTGNGAGLTNIPSGNLTGQVANALVAGTVYTAAQPNITSVGTLSSLAVTGNVTAGNVYANAGTIGANIIIGNTVGGTLTTAAQPNITSVGTLTSLAVTGNVSAGNVSATDVTGTTLGGTLTTAAQPNVTSVGTLTGLGVNGNITAANITANTGIFTGNGSGLSAIAGGNVTGQVANALVAGTVYTAAQPNITSVGTLSSLSVTGNVSGGNLTTNGTLTVTGPGVSSIAGNLDMTSNNIINLAEPVNASDAATKAYVDSVAEGLHTHDSCNAATQTTLATISGGTVTYNNGTAGVGANLVTTGTYTTIDGVTLSDGMRILVKNEANAAHNGIYVRSNSTVLTRATDFDTPAEMAGGDFTFVTAGTLYDNTGWVMTDPVTTVGTTAVNWTQFSGAGTYTAGTGLTLTGTQFSVNTAQPTITSVGTLTGLAVNGNITAANITANTGVFTGNGSGLTALAGGNVTGQVANALVAGTVYTAAQPNITSVGTLSSLTVSGNANVGNIGAAAGVFTTVSGNGSALSSITGANVTGQVANALVAGTVYTAAQPNITSVGTLTTLGVNGTVTAVAFTANTGVFTGNGSGLTAIAGGNVTGQVANALVAGTVYTAAQPNITSVGTLSSLTVSGNANVGNIGAAAGVFTTVSGNGAALTALNASNISTGTLAQARLANSSLTVNGVSIALGGSGTVTASTTNALTLGSYLTGGSFNGGSAVTTAVDATTTNTASKVVARDSNGSFAANIITATLSGAATTAGTVTTAAQPNITSVGTLSSLAVTGNITAGNVSVSTGTVTLGTLTTGANTTAGTVTGNWTLSAGSRWNATYADLAEKYVSDASYEPGTVLVFGGIHEVTLANESDSHRVAGVVSTNPAYLMNAECQGEHTVELALQGRVPVKVHGPVAKGDLMVSGPNGHAVANNLARAGTIIGKALENFNGEHGVVEVVVGRF